MLQCVRPSIHSQSNPRLAWPKWCKPSVKMTLQVPFPRARGPSIYCMLKRLPAVFCNGLAQYDKLCMIRTLKNPAMIHVYRHVPFNQSIVAHRKMSEHECNDMKHSSCCNDTTLTGTGMYSADFIRKAKMGAYKKIGTLFGRMTKSCVESSFPREQLASILFSEDTGAMFGPIHAPNFTARFSRCEYQCSHHPSRRNGRATRVSSQPLPVQRLRRLR
jgi:hypothetical protein